MQTQQQVKLSKNANRLAVALKKRGAQAAFANTLKCESSMLSKWKHGTKPSIAWRRKLEDYGYKFDDWD